MIKELLQQLGWKEKEITCYLALLELGQQPASTLSKRLKIPKATVLFILHRLVERGYVTMNKKGKTEYFYGDPQQLQQRKNREILEAQKSLEELIPLLKEFRHPLSARPQTSFFEGVDACKKAYSQLLSSESEILEFATHDDLADKFGEKWMDDFLEERTKKKIHIRSICYDTPKDRELEPLDKAQCRKTKFVPEKTGMMYSCMAMWEDKLLMLNLGSDCFGILIESAAIVETMKTIHALSWNSRSLAK